MNDRNTDRATQVASGAGLVGPSAVERVARAERSQVMWSWIAVIAMVFILGVTFYAIDTRQDQRHALQHRPTAPSLAASCAGASTTARQDRT